MHTITEQLDFDPVDLAQLASGWETSRNPNRGKWGSLNIEDSAYLADVARLLHRLWGEIDTDEWAGVWAYDVADPLGEALRLAGCNADTDPDLVEAEKLARQLIVMSSL